MSNNRINNLKQEIKKSERAIRICETNKDKILNFIDGLREKYVNKEIKYFEYEKILNKEYNGKKPSDWIEYYNEIINNRKEKIKYLKKRIITKRILSGIFIVSIIISMVLLLFLTYIITEKATETNRISLSPEINIYTETTNKQFNQSGEFTWLPENSGKLISVKISGSIENLSGEKNVNVYLENILILNSENLKSEIHLSPDEKNITKILEVNETNNNETEIIQETNQIIGNETYNEVLTEKTGQNETENENATEENGKVNLTEITTFSDMCEETCDLSSFNFNNRSYKIKIEINGDLLLKINNISYELESEEKTKVKKNVSEKKIEKREEKTKRGKKVSVSGDDNLKNMNISSDIPKSWNIKDKNSLKVYWVENQKYIDFFTYDTNDDKIIDKIEWIIPHFSNQTFEIIIVTKAIYLDENKDIISDIYEEIKSLDNLWSPTIRNNEYVRITFEKNLTNENDITIYPRIVSGNPIIEVYEKDEKEKIAEFRDILPNKYNKILLNSMDKEQDEFDLKIINGSIELNHIIDPITTLVVTSCFVNDVLNSACYNAISADGGTSYALTKNAHIDAPFQTLSGAQTLNSATLFYDSWGTLSGTWTLSVRNARDGTIICNINPAPENAVETRNNIPCNSITPAQLQTGLWLQVNNFDTAAPQSINLDYFFIQVDYTQPSNTAPTIVSINPIPNVNLNAGTTTNVTVIFTAEDLNGASNLNDTTASVSFSKTGEATRTSVPVTGCSAGAPSGNQKTYTCIVTMQYYDAPGTWNAQVRVDDQESLTATSTSTFNVNTLFAESINPGSISFGTVSPGQNDVNSINTRITNIGNMLSNIKIISKNLIGNTNPLEQIHATNIKVGLSSSNVCLTGDQLSDNVEVQITGIQIPKNDGLSTNNFVDITYCMDVPTGISAQAYSATSSQGNAWEIILFLTVFTITKIKKKKLLEKINKEVKERYGSEFEVIIKDTKEKESVKEILIPLIIFRGNNGAAEILCKYLKENLGLRFSEISKLLNRDQRTIALNYKNINKRMKEKIIIKMNEKRIDIPITILKNRKLSILEAIINYLRNKGYKNIEIAKILEKDQRNTSLIYKRALNKLKLK
ncbi:MAG: hypothetical protein QXI33_03020 [Candidatus Pacearchaeota archaeon]